MNYYYSIVSIEFLINVEGTINFEIEGEILGQAFLPAAHCVASVTNKLKLKLKLTVKRNPAQFEPAILGTGMRSF